MGAMNRLFTAPPPPPPLSLPKSHHFTELPNHGVQTETVVPGHGVQTETVVPGHGVQTVVPTVLGAF